MTTIPHYRCQWEVVSLQVTHNFCSAWLQIKGSHALIIGYRSSQNSRKFLLTFTSLLKNITKDTDKHPGEEIHKARSGRGQSAGASIPMELWCTTLPVCRCVHWSRSSLNPIVYHWDFFMEDFSHRSINAFSAPLLFLENGMWGWKFPASDHGLVFLMASYHLGDHQETLIRIKDLPITQEMPKDFGFRSLVSGVRDQRPNSRTRVASSALIT